MAFVERILRIVYAVTLVLPIVHQALVHFVDFLVAVVIEVKDQFVKGVSGEED